MRMSFASSAWRTTTSSSMPNDACSQTDLTMKLAFFRERARLSTIGVIPPSGHGPDPVGGRKPRGPDPLLRENLVGGEKEGLRGRAGVRDAHRVENRRHEEDEPSVAVETFDEIENRVGLERVESVDDAPARPELQGTFTDSCPRRPSDARHRLELNENVELVRLRLLADRIEENRNAHDGLTGEGCAASRSIRAHAERRMRSMSVTYDMPSLLHNMGRSEWVG